MRSFTPIRLGFSMLVAIALASCATANPPIDEDALPEGAIARLGTKTRHWHDCKANTSVDGGRILVLAYSGPQVFYRDVATGRLLDVFMPKAVEGEPLEISSNGRVLVFQNSKFVFAWDIKQDKQLLKIPAKNGEWRPCSISGDGNQIVLFRNGAVERWDARSGEMRKLLESDRPVELLGFALSDTSVLVYDKERLRCLDIESGNIRWEIKSSYSRWQVLPGGRFASLNPGSNTDAKLQLYDLDSGRLAARQRHSDVKAEAWGLGADGDKAIEQLDSGWRVRDAFTGKVIVNLPDVELPLDLTPTGNYLIGCNKREQVQCWDLRTGQARYADANSDRHYGTIIRMKFLADDRTLFSEGVDGRFLKWELKSRKAKEMLPAFDAFDGSAMAHSDDGSSLLRLSKTGEWKLFNLNRESETTGKIQLETTDDANCDYAQTDARTVLVGQSYSDSSDLRRYCLSRFDLQSGKCIFKREEFAPPDVWYVAPDAMLYVRNGKEIRDITTGRAVMSLNLNDEINPWDFLFSPNNTRVAVDQVANYWSKYSGPEYDGTYIYELATGASIFIPIESSVLAFSNDGRMLILASRDAIHFVDSMTGKEISRRTILRPGHPVEGSCSFGAAISSDRKLLATGHPDGTILLWNVPALPRQPAVTPADFDELWNALAASDARKAWTAMARLMDSPAESLQLLKDRLKPTPAMSAEKLNGLLDELVAPQYAHREAATSTLSRMIDLVEDDLRITLNKTTSPEQKQRLTKILQAPLTLHDPERIRRWRVVIVLEQIGTPEAKKLLETIAQSPKCSIEGKAASAALGRLTARR